MSYTIRYLAVLSCLLFSINSMAQTSDDEKLVQLTGVIVEPSKDKVYPVPYVNIGVKNTKRGTYSDFNGFFSLVVVKGETVVFSVLGDKEAEFYVADSLSTKRYSCSASSSRSA